jgi:hypothetical protein
MRKHLILLVALALAVPAVFAQQPATPAPAMQHHHGEGEPMECQAMMQKMQTSQKALDDKLEGLIAEMNKASGAAKVDRMAAVINELVSQRKQMHAQMMSMMPQMMEHSMHHMQSGMAEGMKDCPMMKGQAEKHEGHH